MKKIIYNIGTLAGILPTDVRKLEGEAMNHVECIGNAYLIVQDGLIAGFGEQPEILDLASFADAGEDAEYIDAKGGYVMPCFG